MKISQQLGLMRDALEAWANPLSGTAVVVSNLKDMWAQASKSSQKPLALVCFVGERIRGPFADAANAGRVDRSWNVAITRGRGFSAARGDSLTTKVGNADPFPDNVEQARNLIRNMRDITQEPEVDYKGMKPMQLGNLVIDGYIIEFSTANDLDQLIINQD